MTQISKRKIRQSEYLKIFNMFISVMKNSKSKDRTSIFISEFFYRTEQIMFAKRIGIIYMLMKKVPDHIISSTLSVSTSTIARMSTKMDGKGYQYICKLIEHENETLSDYFERLYFKLHPLFKGKRYREVKSKEL